MSSLVADDAREVRVSLLMDQHSICGNKSLAEAIESAGTPLEFAEGDEIIRDGDYSDDIFFIIRGSVDVVSGGHKHAVRNHRCHVGEMALLDPALGRSANVLSCSDGTVTVKVPGSAMRSIGDQFPAFWRHLGRELVERLRERDRFFVRPNDTPIVFLASSGAAKDDLTTVSTSLDGPSIICRPWTGSNIFQASDFTINSLLIQADQADFAIILATPDDIIEKNAGWRGFLRRNSAKRTARDNVLLEYGLFAGAITRERVFILEKAGVGLPTDLQGLTTLRYSNRAELVEHAATLKLLIETAGSYSRMKRAR